jgi:hypothetical protein
MLDIPTVTNCKYSAICFRISSRIGKLHQIVRNFAECQKRDKMPGVPGNNQPGNTISMKVINALTLTRQNGELYDYGHHYDLAKKREVTLTLLQL